MSVSLNDIERLELRRISGPLTALVLAPFVVGGIVGGVGPDIFQSSADR